MAKKDPKSSKSTAKKQLAKSKTISKEVTVKGGGNYTRNCTNGTYGGHHGKGL